ncbi:cytokine receptor common subunit gamma [Paroedura picta]|uniref:cytokine receptor common subunit gamma n=1 Tax=Paroedura picta TaxID=143630 RepID=UPI004057BA7D
MDVSKELGMFLILALLFLGPGKQTTALPELQDVKCIVFSDDYMICDWESGQKPVSNYSLYYWYAKNCAAECAHYLQRGGVNTGCWFNKSQIDYNLSFNVYLNASNNSSSLKKSYSSLINQVKPNPPVNLTLQSLGNNQLLLTWGTTYRLRGCLQHMVKYWSSTDPSPKESSTEEMMYILPSVDPNKRYTFNVKSKINEKCGTTELWSLTAGPVSWGRNSSKDAEDKAKSTWLWIQSVLYLIGSLLLLILLVLILMRMERVWLVLMPRIPNPHNKFEELFTAYQGNFSEWAGVPKDAVESFKPSYHESICHVTELFPGGGYLPLGSEVLGKAGEVPGISVDPVSKINLE